MQRPASVRLSTQQAPYQHDARSRLSLESICTEHVGGRKPVQALLSRAGISNI